LTGYKRLAINLALGSFSGSGQFIRLWAVHPALGSSSSSGQAVHPVPSRKNEFVEKEKN